MPSDLAKKKAAKKKEAAKARQRSKKPDDLNGEAEQPDTQTNGAESNGEQKTECWEFGDWLLLTMVVNETIVLYYMYWQVLPIWPRSWMNLSWQRQRHGPWQVFLPPTPTALMFTLAACRSPSMVKSF